MPFRYSIRGLGACAAGLVGKPGAVSAIDFMSNLHGSGTLGSAKGVAEVTFRDTEGEKGISFYAISYTSESKVMCDVMSGDFFKGEDMDPLLIQAFEDAMDQFSADAPVCGYVCLRDNYE